MVESDKVDDFLLHLGSFFQSQFSFLSEVLHELQISDRPPLESTDADSTSIESRNALGVPHSLYVETLCFEEELGKT